VRHSPQRFFERETGLYRSFPLRLSLALVCTATLPVASNAQMLRSDVIAEPDHRTIYDMQPQTGAFDKTSGRYLQSVGKRVAPVAVLDDEQTHAHDAT
jgi:hypothetical protein